MRTVLFIVASVLLLFSFFSKTGEIEWITGPLHLAAFLMVWHSIALAIIGALLLSLIIAKNLWLRIIIVTVLVFPISLYSWLSEVKSFNFIQKVVPPPSTVDVFRYQKMHGDALAYSGRLRIEYQTKLSMDELINYYKTNTLRVSSEYAYEVDFEEYRNSRVHYIPYWFPKGLKEDFFKISYIYRGLLGYYVYISDFTEYRSVIIDFND